MKELLGMAAALCFGVGAVAQNDGEGVVSSMKAPPVPTVREVPTMPIPSAAPIVIQSKPSALKAFFGATWEGTPATPTALPPLVPSMPPTPPVRPALPVGSVGSVPPIPSAPSVAWVTPTPPTPPTPLTPSAGSVPPTPSAPVAWPAPPVPPTPSGSKTRAVLGVPGVPSVPSAPTAPAPARIVSGGGKASLGVAVPAGRLSKGRWITVAPAAPKSVASCSGSSCCDDGGSCCHSHASCCELGQTTTTTVSGGGGLGGLLRWIGPGEDDEIVVTTGGSFGVAMLRDDEGDANAQLHTKFFESGDETEGDDDDEGNVSYSFSSDEDEEGTTVWRVLGGNKSNHRILGVGGNVLLRGPEGAHVVTRGGVHRHDDEDLGEVEDILVELLGGDHEDVVVEMKEDDAGSVRQFLIRGERAERGPVRQRVARAPRAHSIHRIERPDADDVDVLIETIRKGDGTHQRIAEQVHGHLIQTLRERIDGNAHEHEAPHVEHVERVDHDELLDLIRELREEIRSLRKDVKALRRDLDTNVVTAVY